MTRPGRFLRFLAAGGRARVAAAVLPLPVCLALIATAFPARAGADAVDIARAAAMALTRAVEAIETAGAAQDRVAALAGTIRAYEAGLDLLRAELREATLRETTLRRRFEAESAEVARLLGVLGAIGRVQADAGQLAHPGGPLGTARAGMLLGEVTPALADRAVRLEAELREVAELRALQTEAVVQLQDGLELAQAARAALGRAMSERADLPQRLVDDPGILAALAAAADTLDGFARGLATRSASPQDGTRRDFVQARGTLALPVRGTVLRRAGEADPVGVTRPGMVLATTPGALVLAPWSATVRYAGPLRGYGNVIVLEPATDYLLVLGGLEIVYVQPGEVIADAMPVGTMPDVGTEAVRSSVPGGERTQTLYIELRHAGEPVDPGVWFALTARND
ncbi:MAG: peptidoglycan DD-metalloendopeptidase family protein [Rhodobacteraceae bacterium]|nr:peptidoglycan DD-metalloendopeptidase family protein [Paracoccaceae bacterium]